MKMEQYFKIINQNIDKCMRLGHVCAVCVQCNGEVIARFSKAVFYLEELLSVLWWWLLTVEMGKECKCHVSGRKQPLQKDDSKTI